MRNKQQIVRSLACLFDWNTRINNRGNDEFHFCQFTRIGNMCARMVQRRRRHLPHRTWIDSIQIRKIQISKYRWGEHEHLQFIVCTNLIGERFSTAPHTHKWAYTRVRVTLVRSSLLTKFKVLFIRSPVAFLCLSLSCSSSSSPSSIPLIVSGSLYLLIKRPFFS